MEEQVKKGKIENFINEKNITAKKLIKASTLIVGLALIVFMTIGNVIFDPSHLDIFKWFTNALILVGIMVFGLLMGESIGSDKQTEKVGGLYQKNLKDYNAIRSSIADIEIYFSQFYLWFKEKELYKKKVEYLIDNSFDGRWAKVIIKHIDKSDLEVGKLILREDDKEKIYLKRNEKGEIIKVKKISLEQQQLILNALSLKLDSPSYIYFLTAFGDSKGGGILEKGNYLQRKLKYDKRWNRTLKIVSSLFISLVWGMATIKELEEGGQTQAWFNLLSRLTAFLTSFVSGWGSSVISVKTRAEIIENKRNVLFDFKTYIDKNEFTPETYDEMVERELKEQIENQKNEIHLIELKEK